MKNTKTSASTVFTEKSRVVYLISPRTPDNFWSMKSSVKALRTKNLMPNSALATLIALTPEDMNVEYRYCDENVSPIDLDMPCDLVAITGYTLHSRRIGEISEAFRKRNIPVALGGAFATLNREEAAKLTDYHFVGEAEYTWPKFLLEWQNGSAASVYEQKEYIDIKDSPPPAWSFINGKDYLYFTVQTSRGCPNNCDFCDVILLVGRKYRTKSVEQVMTEIKNAHAKGAETIFFSDDNFFVNKSFTKKLLNEIIAWNTSQKTPLSFSTQATTKIGDDEEILKLLADARFSAIFFGVESIRKECLDEINKGHIFRYNPKEAVKRVSSYGILPFIGLIVGFDHDDQKTFTEIEQFLNETGSPLASITILNAPKNTTLYDRMKKQNRLNEDFKGVWHYSTNIIPLNLTLEELIENHHTLFKNLYQPENFESRALDWLANITYFSPLYRNSKMSFAKFIKLFYIIAFYLLHEPWPVKLLLFRLLVKTWKMNPNLVKKAVTIMSQYCHYYDFANGSS
ncbi:MAG: radical SAM protein [Thermodesulfobacteriota bacterium]|nr:radical SAM protein [Thermodesulfobacteriota bacterium]